MTSFDSAKIAEIHRHLHSDLPTEPALRVKALESVLVEKALLKTEDIDNSVEAYSEKIGPKNGAKIVARAWVDPDYKPRLLADGGAAIAELGFHARASGMLQDVENTASLQNLVVCTLCSCYPWSVLGLPPTWYKAPAYRSRVVREPRKVLAEMGLELPESTAIRVWDSSAEMRYMVVPKRPDRTGVMTEDELQALVTRDSMIGVAQTTAPDAK